MARPKPDQAIVEIALEFARNGMSHDDIAEQMTTTGYTVSPATVGIWCRRAGIRAGVMPARPAPVIVEPDEADEADEADDGSVDDLVKSLKRMARDMQSDAKTARKIGNTTAAQRSMSAAATLAPVIARLLRASKDERDVLRIPRSELDAARLRHRERMRALLDRPLLCAHCSRKLSIALAGAELDPDAPAPGG